MTEEERIRLAQALKVLALRAGETILDIYNTDFSIDAKADDSPVTKADVAAEAVILEGLAKLTPDIPVIAEESVAAGHLPDIGDGPFWLVDPLDGTREFIKRNGEFTVNIALILDRHPTVGVVHAPAVGSMYIAAGKGRAWRSTDGGADRPITVRESPDNGLTVLASRSHRDPETEEFIGGLTVGEVRSAGSSLKFCLIAEGGADVYPRFGRTMEWDTAAGQAVLSAAGGSVRDREGNILLYGKKGFENPAFIARGA